MKSKHLYLLFCMLGAVVRYREFIRWLAENGFNVSLALFSNRISTFSLRMP